MAKTKVPQPQLDSTGEFVSLIRELIQQQNEVLKVAMETQKSQADVLAKWIGMFTPQGPPSHSTTEEERAKLREEMEAGEWGPVDFDPFNMKDMN